MPRGEEASYVNMVSTPMAGEEEEGGYSEAELVSLASISDLDLGTQPPLFEAEVRAAPANTNTSFPEVASGSRRQRSGSDVFEMTRPKVRCKKTRNIFLYYFKYFPQEIIFRVISNIFRRRSALCGSTPETLV